MKIYITENQLEVLIKEVSSKKEVQTFLNDFGFFIYMNMVKVKSMSNTHKDAEEELNNLLKTFNRPIINGKTYSEIISDTDLLKKPKLLSALFKQIKGLIEYIEPRIEMYVKDGDLKNVWLEKLDKFKKEYRKIVS